VNGCTTSLLLNVFTQRKFVADFIWLKLTFIQTRDIYGVDILTDDYFFFSQYWHTDRQANGQTDELRQQYRVLHYMQSHGKNPMKGISFNFSHRCIWVYRCTDWILGSKECLITNNECCVVYSTGDESRPQQLSWEEILQRRQRYYVSIELAV